MLLPLLVILPRLGVDEELLLLAMVSSSESGGMEEERQEDWLGEGGGERLEPECRRFNLVVKRIGKQSK